MASGLRAEGKKIDRKGDWKARSMNEGSRTRDR